MRYFYLFGVMMLCLLLIHCKKEELKRLENTQKNIILSLEVNEIDDIVMTAKIPRDTTSIEITEETAYFKVWDLAAPADYDSIPVTLQEVGTLPNDTLVFRKTINNARENRAYKIQAFAGLKHIDFESEEFQVQSIPRNITTKDINLKTEIKIDAKANIISLKTKIIVLDNGREESSMVEFDDIGQIP